jgi:hypothetical protein
MLLQGRRRGVMLLSAAVMRWTPLPVAFPRWERRPCGCRRRDPNRQRHPHFSAHVNPSCHVLTNGYGGETSSDQGAALRWAVHIRVAFGPPACCLLLVRAGRNERGPAAMFRGRPSPCQSPLSRSGVLILAVELLPAAEDQRQHQALQRQRLRDRRRWGRKPS